MAKNEQLYAESGILGFTKQLDNASGILAVDVHTANAEGSKIKALNVSSSDTAIRYMEIIVNDGVSDFILGTIAIPITAGRSATGAVPSVNVLDSANIVGLEKDIEGNNILCLPPTWILKARMIVAITVAGALTIDIVGFYKSLTA